MATPTDRAAKLLLKFVNTRVEYIKCLTTSGASLQSASEESAKYLAQNLSAIPALNPETAADIIKLLQNSPMVEEQVELCIRAVQAKVTLADADPLDAEKKDTTRQVIEDFPDYIQAETHLVQAYKTQDPQIRLNMAAKQFRRMGLNHPDERSMARGAACAFPEASELHVQMLSGDYGKYFLEKFKIFSERCLTSPQGGRLSCSRSSRGSSSSTQPCTCLRVSSLA